MHNGHSQVFSPKPITNVADASRATFYTATADSKSDFGKNVSEPSSSFKEEEEANKIDEKNGGERIQEHDEKDNPLHMVTGGKDKRVEDDESNEEEEEEEGDEDGEEEEEEGDKDNKGKSACYACLSVLMYASLSLLCGCAVLWYGR